jgi:hypothetical protein
METICKVIDKELGAGWAVGMGLVRGQRQECPIMARDEDKRKLANGLPVFSFPWILCR